MNQTIHTSFPPRHLMRRTKISLCETLCRSWRLIIAVALAGVMTSSALAQTATFKSSLTRVTVPVGFTGSVIITNVINITTNGVIPDGSGNVTINNVNLSAAGVPTTPAGLTFNITDPNNNAVSTIAGKLNTSGFKTNIWVTLNLASVAEGIYTFGFSANGGATNTILLALQVGYVWNGGTNALATGPGTWSDGTKWLGGGGSAPGTTDDVILGDLGGQTNSLAGFNTSSTNMLTNVVITASTTVGSLRFSPSNTPTKFYNVQINDGQTLAATGPNGFSMMKDSLNNINGSAAGMTTTFSGAKGSLLVSNETASFSIFIDNVANTLDLSGLGNFVSDVSQVSLGDSVLWPFYRNLNDQNAYGGIPRQSLTTFNLARTNIIKAVYADPNNYTNSDSRHFSLNFMNSELTGSSTAPIFNLGISNVFNLDSVDFINGNSRGTVQFNPAFTASNPIAIFRGTNGVSRMSLYSQADGGGTNTANSNVKSTINFQGGTLDMKVDRFYIGRDRVQIQFNSTPNYQGNFFMNKGTLDANTMVLGFREHPGAATNTWSGYNGYCEGTLSVSNTGVVRINNSLTLGYTKETNLQGLGSAGNTEYGQVTVVSNSAMYANMIYVGGPAYGNSKNNFIIVSNSSSLSISNQIGGPNQLLDHIDFANGSALTLNLSATNTLASVYTTNFIMTGSNSLVIATMRNPGSLVNGLQIPLLKRSAGGAPNFTVINQSGVNGQIVVDGTDANQQDFQVILSTPKTLLWKGSLTSSDWDNTTTNWVNVANGSLTNFSAGDNVIFDDTATQFSINLVSSAVILPGSITMTNIANAYVLNNSGGGSIIGSATLNKYGANNVEVDGPTSISINLNAGTLTGSGSVATMTVNSGTAMNFSGAIAGNLNSAGVATLASLGTLNGALLVLTGGVVTNAGIMNGTFSVSTNGLFVNNPSSSLASIGTSSGVSLGGILVNRGTIAGVNLTIGGTFEDTGEGSTTLSGLFTANPGATIIPGGDGIGTTTIQAGTGTGFPGRVSLSTGSTNIFKVDIIGAVNTELLSGFQDFGGSENARSQDGCTLVITNVTGSFAAGQSFTLFQYSGGGNPIPDGSSTNRYPIISPATPGPGLAWDLTHLWVPNGSGVSGVIGIVSSSSSVILTNGFAGDGTGTNLVGTFSWDPAYLGYRLQTQANPLSVGLSTNWSNVAPPSTNYTVSWAATSYMVTNVIGTNCVFYRLTFP